MLSQELRPKRWEDIAGQKENVNILKAIVKNPENSPKCLIFQGAFGSGKCVVGDTRVETSKGYLKIKDIIKNPVFDEEGFMDISSYNIKVLDGRVATHFYFGGERDTVRISSKFFSLEGTHNHKVMCITDSGFDWVRLGDLKVGDYVCVSSSRNKEPIFSNRTPMFDGLKVNTPFNNGYLFGAMAQFGRITGDSMVEMICDSSRFSYIKDLLKDDILEGLKIHKGRRVKDSFIIGNSLFYDFVNKHYGITNDFCSVIPEWVYASNEYFLSGFLTSIFDFGLTIDESSNPCLVFRHKNRDLVKLFYDVLMVFGVVCILYEERLKKDTRLICTIRDKVSIKDFSGLISPFNRGMDGEFMRLVGSFGECRPQNAIPKTEYVKYIIDCIVGKAKDCGVKLVTSISNKGERTIKEATLRSLVEELQDRGNISVGEWTGFLDFLDMYRPVQIESIEYGKNLVYDLTVDGTHCFLANGLLNHNTTSARILARELNRIKDDDFDIVNSKYYYEFDSTVIGNVDAIRSLREEFTVSYGDYWRVVVLDEAHAVSNAAQNALLKMLEETTGKTIYIMATTEVNKLLPTIRSRSLELQFNPVPKDEIFKNLTSVCEDRGIQVSEDIKRLISERSYGHMRNAHMMLDKYLLIGEDDFRDSVKSAVSLYCDFLIATYDNDRDKVLDIINSLMDIPKNSLQSDWSTVMVESIKSYCGFEISDEDIKRLVLKFGQDFGIVSSCYMSSWIRNAFYDMSYFQATFLNLFMVVRGALNKKYSNKAQVGSSSLGGNRFGVPVR